MGVVIFKKNIWARYFALCDLYVLGITSLCLVQLLGFKRGATGLGRHRGAHDDLDEN